MDKSLVKENIRKAREEMNLTQSELASRMGISRTAYRNFETGETKVFSDHISTLARICGRSEEELILGYSPRSHDDTLHEVFTLREQRERLIEDYERRLAELRAALEARNALLESYEKHIRTLEELVAMMARQVPKNN